MPRKGLKPRLLLADDNTDVLQETARLLSQELELVGTTGSGIGLIQAAQRFRPDIIVSDANMPDISGIEATRQILASGYCPAIVIFSISREAEVVEAAFRAGALGYVLKEDAGEDLINAIRSAIQGERFYSSGLRTAKIDL